MDIVVDNWKKWEHMRAGYSKHKWSPLPSSKYVGFDNAGDNRLHDLHNFPVAALNRRLRCYIFQSPRSTNPRISKIHDELEVLHGNGICRPTVVSNLDTDRKFWLNAWTHPSPTKISYYVDLGLMKAWRIDVEDDEAECAADECAASPNPSILQCFLKPDTAEHLNQLADNMVHGSFNLLHCISETH